ncbi:unnamed protein product [Ceratitis capitata]|uniref:(Mediterranean fruit fly) hypothetical protein n=1 Tax=Ceratitis capitata TaxID=7213 RepID=A0A811USW8_CERCA|nr:unnamed protein product [Ceratitis capitata]
MRAVVAGFGRGVEGRGKRKRTAAIIGGHLASWKVRYLSYQALLVAFDVATTAGCLISLWKRPSVFEVLVICLLGTRYGCGYGYTGSGQKDNIINRSGRVRAFGVVEREAAEKQEKQAKDVLKLLMKAKTSKAICLLVQQDVCSLQQQNELVRPANAV